MGTDIRMSHPALNPKIGLIRILTFHNRKQDSNSNGFSNMLIGLIAWTWQ